jgi:hypothetical protein
MSSKLGELFSIGQHSLLRDVVLLLALCSFKYLKRIDTTQIGFKEISSQVRTLKCMFFGAFVVVAVEGLLAATSLQGVPDVIRAKQLL